MKTTPKTNSYTITIRNSATGSWGFRYIGNLTVIQKILIRLAGWKITDRN